MPQRQRRQRREEGGKGGGDTARTPMSTRSVQAALQKKRHTTVAEERTESVIEEHRLPYPLQHDVPLVASAHCFGMGMGLGLMPQP